jgi:hypothetical protein
LQALDFLEDKGVLTPEARRDVPTTSFKRLLSSPTLREKLGVGIDKQHLVIRGNEKQVAKALLHVVNDLASGKIKTGDIYTKQDRENYANSLPSDIVVKQSTKAGKVVPIKPGTSPSPTPKPPVIRLPKQRDKLIPRDCALNVTDPRLRLIEAELRSLSIDTYTNAVSVLFRVFIELSADVYIGRVPLSVNIDDSLMKKLVAIAKDLEARQKLTKQQARPVHRAAAKDSFLAPSITQMNQYVHNQYVFPTPSDLRLNWDSLQPFFIAIWTP